MVAATLLMTDTAVCVTSATVSWSARVATACEGAVVPEPVGAAVLSLDVSAAVRGAASATRTVDVRARALACRAPAAILVNELSTNETALVC